VCESDATVIVAYRPTWGRVLELLCSWPAFVWLEVPKGLPAATRIPASTSDLPVKLTQEETLFASAPPTMLASTASTETPATPENSAARTAAPATWSTQPRPRQSSAVPVL